MTTLTRPAHATALPDIALVDTGRGEFTVRQGGHRHGEPVVLLHGWPESSYSWDRLAGHLGPGFRMVAPDLRGMGDSTRDGDRKDFTKDQLALDVLAVLDRLGIDGFQLVGHDWGGVVAQEMALAAPARVTRLALLNAPAINNKRGDVEATKAIREFDNRSYWYQHFQQQRDLPEHMIPGNEDVWLRYFLRTGLGEPLPDDIIAEHVRWYSLPDTPGAVANYYRSLRRDRERWETLADHVWPMPAMFVYGRNDPVIVPAFLRGIEASFARITVHDIDAGHFVHEEDPAEVAALLDAFLLPRKESEA